MRVGGNFHLGGNFVTKSMSGVHNVFKECKSSRTFVKTKGI